MPTTQEGWNLSKRAELLALEAKMQGMIALNTYRSHLGQGIAYDDTPFFELAREAENLAEVIMREGELK